MSLRTVILFCVVFTSLFAYEDAKELDADQPGVCITTMKEPPKTRIVPVIQKVTRRYVPRGCKSNKCSKIRTFNVRKTKLEEYVPTVNRTICCGGWSYVEDAERARCEPRCLPACGAGADCVAPNSCSCRPPHEPDLASPNSCLLPSCLVGFHRDDNDTCAPVCSSGCANGDCIDPDHCRCHEGYRNPDGNVSICEANCPQSCVNGSCSSPDICECDEGFKKSSDGASCEPVCTNACTNGRCVAPGVCDCNSGYVQRNGTCVPHCSENCHNGECVGPEQCQCRDGYALDAVNNFSCNPVCQRPCVRGTCIAPDLCECDAGYKEDEQDRYTCRASCSRSCGQAGRCTAPEVCTCYSGFEIDSITGSCRPSCSQPCTNGECTSPDTCTCNTGYDPVNRYTCKPHCDPSCINSDCINPGECSCHDGYAKTGNGSECLPKCDSCSNGICIAPNDCRCRTGFTKSNGSCEPICSKPCVNGTCIAPEKCACNEGFFKTDDTCVPVCSQSCTNGKCTSPEVCTCIIGYTLRANDSYTCEKACKKPCHLGVCSIHGTCECGEGYFLDADDPFFCHPVCAPPCRNGVCTKPGICECMKGYEFKNDSSSECRKVCDMECIHGICNEAGVCECEQGYHGDTCNDNYRPKCSECDGKCDLESKCRCANMSSCEDLNSSPGEPFAQRYVSSVPWTWVYGAVGLLLLVAVVAGVERVWRRNRNDKSSPTVQAHDEWSHNGLRASAPGTLIMGDMRNPEPLVDEEAGTSAGDDLIGEAFVSPNRDATIERLLEEGRKNCDDIS